MPLMDPWRILLQRLPGSNLIAEWRLTSGVAFFMTPPPVEQIDEHGFNKPGTVQFSELVTVVVRANQPVGGLSKTNDLAAVRSCLPLDGLSASDHGDLIELRVSDAVVR